MTVTITREDPALKEDPFLKAVHVLLRELETRLAVPGWRWFSSFDPDYRTWFGKEAKRDELPFERQSLVACAAKILEADDIKKLLKEKELRITYTVRAPDDVKLFLEIMVFSKKALLGSRQERFLFVPSTE